MAEGGRDMRVKTLVENTSLSEHFGNEHGLSLYLETEKHTVLFDSGCGSLFVENAQKLGVDLSKVEYFILSHSHLDHGGGIPEFLKANRTAQLYIHERAFDGFFAELPNGDYWSIGIDASLREHPRVIRTQDLLVIDEELELFSDVTGQEFPSTANHHLLMKEGGTYRQDTFAHEQNLIINESGHTVLIAGCAHRGIVNIVNRFREMKGRWPDVVIGGFHLYNSQKRKSEDPKLVHQIGAFLKQTGAVYFTGHCTGLEATRLLIEQLGPQVRALSSGLVFDTKNL